MAVKASSKITLIRVNDGATGPPGPAGKGIKSTSITYKAGTSGTVPPTGTWESTIPSVSQGQYLWSKIYIVYTDGTTSTTYSVSYIPKNGETGATGATGQGVSSITQQYYLSTSKTTQTGGSWVTSMPTWSVGKYLWTRYLITYKNPTSTAYTNPICDSSWEAVNEIQIGGRNLLLNSKSKKIKAYQEAKLTFTEGVEVNEWGAVDAIGVKGSRGTSSVIGTLSGTVYSKSINEMKYVHSIYIKNNGTEKITVTNNGLGGSMNINPGESKRAVIYGNGNGYSFIQFGFLVESTAEFSFIYWHPKIEEGNKATDWTMAPEDMDDTINDVYDQITQQNAELSIEMGEIIASLDSTYVTQTEFGDFKNDTSNEIKATSESITAEFNKTITSLDESTSSQFQQLYKYIKMDGENGITIGSGNGAITLTLDNDKGIVFSNNGVPFGSWDGINFHTGNIVIDVNERAQFGNFAYVPRSDGSLSFMKVQ